MKMPDPDDPNLSIRGSWGCLKIVFTCFLVSLAIQVGWPTFVSTSITILCKTNFISKDVKRIFHCVNFDDDKRKYTMKRWNPGQITYFAEPLQSEPWFAPEEQVIRDNPLMAKLPDKSLSADGRPEPWTESEALASLQAAKKSREVGNFRRAEIIIQHAYALAPHHPDVLTEYGIFVETVRKNVLEAEGLYLKALNANPSHSEALTRRAKTLPLVEEIDNKMLKEIERKREKFLKIPRSNPALRRAMKENYFQHVYHTVALEGNTMSLYQTRSILESRIAVAGKSIIEHNEILGMDAALRFLNQSLAHIGHLTVHDILAIHKRVLGFVDPIAAGVLRTTQVYVGSFAPVPPEYVQSEMEEFMEWLNDEDTLSLDPVELSALAHYKLVFIHPFIDGNGRTARLLMNFILMQAGYPPVIIPVEQRNRYYTTLKQANEGDLRPFIRFVAEHADKALQYFLSATSVCDIKDCPTNVDVSEVSQRIISPHL